MTIKTIAIFNNIKMIIFWKFEKKLKFSIIY